jgi:hypothetical protein
MRKLVGYAGLVIILIVFVAGFFAYFVRSFDAANRVWYDGLGRALSDTPAIVRFFFGKEREWTGWLWLLTDFVVFWGGIGIAYLLIQFGFGAPVPSKKST